MLLHVISVFFLGMALRVALPWSNATQHAACAVLSVQLPETVHYRGSTTFSDSVGSYFTRQEQETLPLCVVRPSSADQVSSVVSTMRHFLVVGGQFAVRSGGHGPFFGGSNLESGVVVDLGLLDQVQVSDDRSSVNLGPGSRWWRVWQILDPLEITVAGGRDAGVGVGGYLLGGGMSYLGPLLGWGCESVLEYEVVLASGEIVTVNEKSHPDLFLALRGGSNNFGIVTRFTMKTYPLGKFWGGFVAHPSTALDKQATAFSDFMGSDPFDPHAAIFQSYGYVSNYSIISNGLWYTKPVEHPKPLELLSDKDTAVHSTLRMGNMSSFAAETGSFQTYDNRQTWYTTSFAHSPEIYSTIYSIWNASLSEVSDVENIGWFLTLQPAPVGTGSNILGIDTAAKRFGIANITPVFTNAADDEKVHHAARRLMASIDSATKAAGVYHPYRYLNYAHGEQNVISGYGDASKAKLQAVSKKYDPHGLFQKGVPGGFKLFA